MFVKVAVPRPLDSLFDYRYDEVKLGPIGIGDLVRVPFGRTSLNACVLEVSNEAPKLPEKIKLKSVTEKLHADFKIPESVLNLARFGSEYYQYPVGEALFIAVPPKPEKILNAREPKARKPVENGRALSSEQSEVLQQIERDIAAKPDSVFLLEGITGSGKTEVYIEAAKKILREGKSVLILVPEIALTAQLRDRFESGLGDQIALWHSALSDGLRQTQWRKVKSGEIKVVIGARSAIFAPFENLGLIVVDEEHDQTYKQEERFRYQARDLALYRGKQANCPVILGSATPSLETVHRVREGRTIQLHLRNRYSQKPLPSIHLISLLEEPPVGAGTIRTPLSEPVIRAMQATLDRGEQVLVFLNRRGYSQFILCHTCGWVKKCSRCSISMTHYQKREELRCHVCGLKERVPQQCEDCHGVDIFGMGSGTESLEEDLSQLLNGAKILRLDRDQITSQKRLEETLNDFRELKSNILIGTQMLVKGHDFPKVTCVVVVSADMLLKWPDFRAGERALQTLIQVSGRAGRAELPGHVYIQGYDLDHPVIKVLTGELEQLVFLEEELSLRQMLYYPPYSRFVRFRFEHEDENRCRQISDLAVNELRKMLTPELEARLMGPSESLLFRALNRYRFDIYFKAPTAELLFKTSRRIKQLAIDSEIDVIVDVDPYNS